MARKDIIVNAVNNNFRTGTQQPPVVQAPDTGYLYQFISINDNSLYYCVSQDKGISWSGLTLVSNDPNVLLAIYPDWETPGDTGKKIHIAFVGSTADNVIYMNLDTFTDTLSSPVTVVDLTSTGTNPFITISKMRGGNLIIVFNIDGGTETGAYKSTDGGGTWGVISNPNEGAADSYLLFPGFAADNQDAILIFWDNSASEISRKTYSDSGDAWSETSISTGMTFIASTTCVPQFSALVDETNSRIILIAWTNRNTVNADLLTWWVTDSSITAKTDVVTNSGGGQQTCSLQYVNGTGNLYAFYGGKSDGSETTGLHHIYYKVSADLGVTWGSETVLSQFQRGFDVLFAPRQLADFFSTTFRNSGTSLQLYTSVDISSGGGNANVLYGSVIH